MQQTNRFIKSALVCITFLCTALFTQSFYSAKALVPEVVINSSNCDSIPPLNKQVIEFATSRLNQKVGQGESWDLASEALDFAGAKWDHEYAFGRKIDPKKECILEGDIIQFDRIKIEYRENNIIYRENLPNHTAIIFQVIAQDNFILIEQNTGKLGHKVGTSPLDLKINRSINFRVYRPGK